LWRTVQRPFGFWRIAFVLVLIGGATITAFRFEEHRGYSTAIAQTMAVNN
jgi:hypothetical protein